jgi:hypothetical protein
MLSEQETKAHNYLEQWKDALLSVQTDSFQYLQPSSEKQGWPLLGAPWQQRSHWSAATTA